MLHAFFSLPPLFVALLCTLNIISHWEQRSNAQRSLLVYTIYNVMYFSTTGYFMFNGFPNWLAIPWLLSAWMLDPAFYYTILHFTSERNKLDWKNYLLVLPSLIAAAIQLFHPEFFNSWTDRILKIVFTSSIYAVCLQKVFRFEKQINNSYSETEDKSPRPIRILLVVMLVFSLVEFTANLLPVGDMSNALLYFYWICFAAILYSVVYVINGYQFSALEMEHEIEEDDLEIDNPNSLSLKNVTDSQEQIGKTLSKLMNDDYIFLQQNLKINDLASMIGTNRTYLSRYVNQQLNMSFSDYINSKRIKYAVAVLKATPDISLIKLTAKSGFANRRSFLINYRKFTGKPFQENK